MAKRGDTLGGRYGLERELAGGGMGQVWVGRQLALDRLVAIKLMSAASLTSEALRARFEREAKACGQLRSPHVVQVYDFGIEDGTPFLVMELLEGEDLGTLQRERPIWPLSEVASVVREAARGLTDAHAAGIVHRDVKLSNLFRARVGDQQIVKLVDFGIALAPVETGRRVTATNVQLGTPSYMSPEQVLARNVDHRSDLWSLGVVAFKLLTGHPPFAGESALLVAQKIVEGSRTRLAEVTDGLPPELEAFFERALASTPEERFQSAHDLASMLERLAAAHPSAIGRPRADEARPTAVPGSMAGADVTGVTTPHEPPTTGPRLVAMEPPRPMANPHPGGTLPWDAQIAAPPLGVARPPADAGRPATGGLAADVRSDEERTVSTTNDGPRTRRLSPSRRWPIFVTAGLLALGIGMFFGWRSVRGSITSTTKLRDDAGVSAPAAVPPSASPPEATVEGSPTVSPVDVATPPLPSAVVPPSASASASASPMPANTVVRAPYAPRARKEEPRDLLDRPD